MFTRGARATGYRDGVRVAVPAAKARAYRDGVRDGWASVMDAASDEKTSLDQAHAQRKTPKEPAVPPNAPPMPTAPPKPTHTPTPAPAQTPAAGPDAPLRVTGIDKTDIHLAPGADRTTVSRGEIRSFKSYERTMSDRRTSVQQVADDLKALAKHATDQAANLGRLLDAARGVKGGDKLLATLNRLHEDAKLQAAAATEAHKQAVRSIDSLGALLSNVATRYAGVYKAVVDSDETLPAEMAFYKE
ncbi:hypothetical protein ACFWG5_34430 [Streptomyces hydrogenans]|uniref:hypothetical protein n=1 Tax=Streptomyces hydrogenans TaxID=1873719 RepID=UPI00366516B7